MGFRRGFKTEAQNLALEVRAELNVDSLEPLDPLALAASLDVPVWTVSEFAETNALIEPLLGCEQRAFSALTVFDGTRRTIVHNDAHALVRQNSNIAHELAHGLLHHPPTPALDDIGCRDWNQDIEDEASWLGGELLVTFDAAMMVARKKWTAIEAAERLCVSDELLEWRIRMTGARQIVQRAEAKRRSRTN